MTLLAYVLLVLFVVLVLSIPVLTLVLLYELGALIRLARRQHQRGVNVHGIRLNDPVEAVVDVLAQARPRPFRSRRVRRSRPWR